MLDIDALTLVATSHGEQKALLYETSAKFPNNHLGAIIGPSGSGKSTLIKAIAGMHEPDAGTFHWQGRNLIEEEDLAPSEIGYVPQFSIAYDELTVWENIEATTRLRVAGLSSEEIENRTEFSLIAAGLDDIPERRVKVLSGGQKRRLSLALELVTHPQLLLCDEVTSGLDPKSETDVMKVLRKVASKEERIVLAVTHSLRHLSEFDSVLVMYEGHLTYHGQPEHLLHYFNVKSPEDVFPRLAKKSAESWHSSWLKHREHYYESMGIDLFSGKPIEPDTDVEDLPTSDPFADVLPPDYDGPDYSESDLPRPERKEEKKPVEDVDEKEEDDEEDKSASLHDRIPGIATQFWVLLARRLKIFFRNPGQLWLHVALILGFPCLVVIFALDGLPAVTNQIMSIDANPLELAKDAASFSRSAISIGSLVSGLVMFQVVLLTLMGANNGAREIAAERQLFEKERLGGVRPVSYLLSKLAFLSVLVVLQSFWMAWFVKAVCRIPGDFGQQLLLLVLVNAALTAVSLGISSLMKSAEQASLVSIYLVGFQLPLSGAVLALPELAAAITQPFIAAYWAWSGVLMSMKDTRYYDVALLVTQTGLSPAAACLWILGCHVIGGILIAYIGLKRSSWH